MLPPSTQKQRHVSYFLLLAKGAWSVTTFVTGANTYAIVASYVSNGVQLIDVSDPSVPVAVGSASNGVNGFTRLGGASGVSSFVMGASTYAVVASFHDDSVALIDVSDPSIPMAVGIASDGVDGFTNLDGANGISSFAIGASTHAFVASELDNGCQIINLINTPSPTPPPPFSPPPPLSPPPPFSPPPPLLSPPPVDLCAATTYFGIFRAQADRGLWFCDLWLDAGHSCSTIWEDVCATENPFGAEHNPSPLSSVPYCGQCGGGSSPSPPPLSPPPLALPRCNPSSPPFSPPDEDDNNNIDGLGWFARIAPGMLLGMLLVLFCRHYYRLSRDRAILQLSRDRAQSDLQMIIHQRARAPMSDRSSFPESQETVRPAISVSAISVSGASLPPGPPSSAHSEHAASQLAAAPSTPFVAGGVPPATMGPSGPSSAPDHAISLALPNRTATIGAPVLAPPAKPRCKAAYAKTAYLEFCRVTRPLLPKSLRNAEREKVIGERWKALSAAEKAHYKVKGETPAKARPLSAAARTVAARTVAAAASGDDTDWNAKRPRTTV